MTAAAPVALRKSEHDRAESPSKLLAEIAIVLANASNERTKASNGLNRNIESLKGRFRLHARLKRKNRDDAKIVSRLKTVASARFFRP